MATLTLCDGGCSTQSPDAKGFHIANDWVEIKVSYTTARFTIEYRQVPSGEYIFCDPCWERIQKAMNIPAKMPRVAKNPFDDDEQR